MIHLIFLLSYEELLVWNNAEAWMMHISDLSAIVEKLGPRAFKGDLERKTLQQTRLVLVSGEQIYNCCEYASAVRYSLLDGRKQRVLYQGLCNQHLMIRWYDQSLLVITTKEGRGYI
jgi:hypothetical protein